MYRKVLIPLDGSKDAEAVMPLIRHQLDPDGELVFLQVVQPGRSQIWPRSYCSSLLGKLGMDGKQWRCEIVESRSIPEGIVRFASSEGVDLIAMYTHGRKGLAGILKKSIAKEVVRRAPMDPEKRTPIEVKVFNTQELAKAA